MKAIATQTLIFLVLLATLITISIPSIINQIKPGVTTTTTYRTKTNTTTCTDSDNGLNYYIKGEVTNCNWVTEEEPGSDSLVGCSLHTDFCEGNKLWEYYCEGNKFKFEKYVCPDGCDDGACISEPNVRCTDSDKGVNPTERGTTSGINGTFTDYCTLDGNLVEYYCEIIACPDPDCFVPPCPACPQPKYVLSREVDCAGLCQNGICPSFCPEYNEKLKYTYIRDDAMRVELEGTNNYSCLLTLDNKQDNFDCREDIYLDMEVAVQSFSKQWNICIEEFSMSIAATNIYGDRGTCTYKCEVLT